MRTTAPWQSGRTQKECQLWLKCCRVGCAAHRPFPTHCVLHIHRMLASRGWLFTSDYVALFGNHVGTVSNQDIDTDISQCSDRFLFAKPRTKCNMNTDQKEFFSLLRFLLPTLLYVSDDWASTVYTSRTGTACLPIQSAVILTFSRKRWRIWKRYHLHFPLQMFPPKHSYLLY
jgi:hypothetical protein